MKQETLLRQHNMLITLLHFLEEIEIVRGFSSRRTSS
jgi:hypothetical protein